MKKMLMTTAMACMVGVSASAQSTSYIDCLLDTRALGEQ